MQRNRREQRQLSSSTWASRWLRRCTNSGHAAAAWMESIDERCGRQLTTSVVLKRLTAQRWLTVGLMCSVNELPDRRRCLSLSGNKTTTSLNSWYLCPSGRAGSIQRLLVRISVSCKVRCCSCVFRYRVAVHVGASSHLQWFLLKKVKR